MNPDWQWIEMLDPTDDEQNYLRKFYSFGSDKTTAAAAPSAAGTDRDVADLADLHESDDPRQA